MLHIIQPAIPKYRESFFDMISGRYNARFITAKKDFLGVETTYSRDNVIMTSGFLVFFGFAYWHKGMPLIKGIEKGDTVVLCGNPRVINYFLLLLINKLRGVKTIWWGHGWTAGSNGVLTKIRHMIMKIPDALLLYTDEEKFKFYQAKNIYALNNGLDSHSIEEARRNAYKINASNPIESSDTVRLLFIGRLTQKTNFNLILKAMPYITNPVEIHVIGSGDEESNFRDTAINLRVNNKIVWYGKLFDESKIASVALKCDAFIYPGSVGLSLIHMFNYGLPAIIHNDKNLHMPEIAAFKEGYNGFTFLEDDKISLASTINLFSNLNKTMLAKMKENSFNTVRQSFNSFDMFSRFKFMMSKVSNNE